MSVSAPRPRKKREQALPAAPEPANCHLPTNTETPTDKPRKRMGRPSRQDMQAGPDAATLLLHAATAEFVEHGYEGTSTNRISERAGFAPQTFYRWYKDKLDIFLAVHGAWAEAEMAQLEAMLNEPGSSQHLAEACVESYRSFLVFQRSVQRLAQDTPAVRRARAQARQARLTAIQCRQPGLPAEEIAAMLITVDHLCEALAEGEFEDLDLHGDAAYSQLASIIERIRQG
jgi:AcrR family transcriptional regulator